MNTISQHISRLAAETGQTMSEYAVVLSVIVLVTVLAYTQLGDAIEAAITAMRTTL